MAASHWRAELAAPEFSLPTQYEDFEAWLHSDQPQHETIRRINRLTKSARWLNAARACASSGDWSACGRLLELPDLQAVMSEAPSDVLARSALWTKLWVILTHLPGEALFPLVQVRRLHVSSYTDAMQSQVHVLGLNHQNSTRVFMCSVCAGGISCRGTVLGCCPLALPLPGNTDWCRGMGWDGVKG